MIALPHNAYRSTDTVATVRTQIAENLEAIANALHKRQATADEAAEALRRQADDIRPTHYFGD